MGRHSWVPAPLCASGPEVYEVRMESLAQVQEREDTRVKEFQRVWRGFFC